MSETRIDNFNTQPLMLEIENVIKSGLNNILKDFMQRYDLLEKTHNKIMNLPSVKNELNKQVDGDSDTESSTQKCKNDDNIISDVKKFTSELVSEKMCDVESKLGLLEKKYDAVLPILDKILNKLQSLNEDVKVLKQQPSDNKDVEPTRVIKASIVSACENENIKFEIKEAEPVINENEKADTQVAGLETVAGLEEEEAEEEEEEEEEEAEEEAEEPDEEQSVETETEEAEEEEESVAEEKSVAEEEEEEEVTEIEIDDVTYFTNDDENGFIYEATEDEEVGDKVGYFKDGEPFFYADEK